MADIRNSTTTTTWISLNKCFLVKPTFAGLVLVFANFDEARFEGEVKLSDKTRFYGDTCFHNVIFQGRFFCDRAQFDAPVSFVGSRFRQHVGFYDTKFMGGASFANVTFEGQVDFNDSRFEERYFPE